jgi:hypothetical protein
VEVAVEPGERLVEQEDLRLGASDRATATRLPRRPRGCRCDRSPKPARPTTSSSSSARRRRSALPHAAIRNPNATLSATDRWGKSCSSWNTMPTWRRCVGRPVTSTPSTDDVPRCGRRRARRSRAAGCSCRCPTDRAGRRPRRGSTWSDTRSSTGRVAEATVTSRRRAPRPPRSARPVDDHHDHHREQRRGWSRARTPVPGTAGRCVRAAARSRSAACRHPSG